jgi:hypothetical protein
MSRLRALVASCSLLVSCVAFTASAQANPLGISWRLSTNAHLYAKPTGILVAGRCNRYDPAFQAARAKGAELLAYINPVNRPDHRICELSEHFYMGNRASVPLWPFPSYGQRQLTATTRMTDMRPGSAWIQHVVSYVGDLMREGRVDGVFLDNVGARSWMPLAEWKSWPQFEKDIYTDGHVDLVRRLDALRRQIDPNFIIVNQSIWDRGDARGFPGERYVDGVSIEHPNGKSTGQPPLQIWAMKYVAKPFSNLGHRRVFIIANNTAEAKAWAKVPGVTHVSDQSGDRYAYPNKPVVPFVPLNDR